MELISSLKDCNRWSSLSLGGCKNATCVNKYIRWIWCCSMIELHKHGIFLPGTSPIWKLSQVELWNIGSILLAFLDWKKPRHVPAPVMCHAGHLRLHVNRKSPVQLYSKILYVVQCTGDQNMYILCADSLWFLYSIQKSGASFHIFDIISYFVSCLWGILLEDGVKHVIPQFC